MPSHLPANEEQGSTSHALTTPIAVYGEGASHIVKVQVGPIHRRAAGGLVYSSAEVGNNRQATRQYSPTSAPMSFLIIGDAYIKTATGSPEDHPIAVASVSPPIASQSDYNPPLNATNPTVKLISEYQQFDGSFPVRDDFITLLTGSTSAPPLPADFAAITGLEQEKQVIWITMVALAVFAKNLPEDEDSWGMLAEKAETFVSTRLESLGVDTASVSAMVNRLKRAAAKYVSYKFWFPILKGSDSSLIILVVSIDG